MRLPKIALSCQAVFCYTFGVALFGVVLLSCVFSGLVARTVNTTKKRFMNYLK